MPSFKPTIVPTLLATTLSPVASPYDVTYTIVTVVNNVTAVNIDSSAVVNALNSALVSVLSTLAAPDSVQVTSETTISSTFTPTYAPATSPTQKPTTSHHDLSHHQLDLGYLASHTHTTASLQVEYTVVYNLQSTSYSSSSALLDSIRSTLDYGIVQTTRYLTLLQASKVTQLQGITSTSLTSVTSQQTQTSDNTSGDDAYNGSSRTKLIVGTVVGGISIAIIVFLFVSLFSMEEDHIESYVKSMSKYPMWIAVLAGVLAIGLVAGWAQDNKHSDIRYLGKPSRSNIFAWHPVLMVCFFFCQIQALVNWSVFSDHFIAKLAHVFAHVVGIVLLILGLIAVVRYNYDNKSPSLNTMHGWVGVCAIAIFGSNFLWGSAMALITAINPSSKIRKFLPLLIMHRIIGSCAMILSGAAILTGIMDKLPYGSCFYILSSTDKQLSRRDTDPAENYSFLPGSCKIAHGLGIAVIIACMFSIIGVIARSYSDQSITPSIPYTEAHHESSDGDDRKPHDVITPGRIPPQ